MEKHFVTYNQALALKELGFKKLCFGWYEHSGNFYYCYQEGLVPPSPSKKLIKGCCLAPLKSQVFEWFREKHGLFSEIQPYLIIGTQWRYTITNRNNSSGLPHKEQFKTYEEAESACIDKLIEIVK